MTDEKSLLIHVAESERADEYDRFNAAATLAELGYKEEAVKAFSIIRSTDDIDTKVYESAIEAVEQLRRGEIPDQIDRGVMPAPIMPDNYEFPPRPL
ncbi:hypothetical protein ACIBQX_00550 [Nonomuraea sp. NPDC049714]|uniref:hypothetical protein n=1 Tax=Nonomuraea sp. NPDC049714 TaxID=3364357 RepID=UPI0037AB764A